MTTTKHFSKKEAIRFGWETTKKNFWFIVGIFLLSQLIPNIPQFMFSRPAEDNVVFSSIVIIIGLVLQFVISVGITNFSLAYVDHKKPVLKNLVKDTKTVWDFFLVSMLSTLIMIGGFILLIIPGILLALKLKFVGYYVIDQHLAPREAIKASWNATVDIKWQLFLLDLLCLGVFILGVLALGIGFFVSLPVASLAQAYVYRQLTKQQKSPTLSE